MGLHEIYSYASLTNREVKMAGCWPSFFGVFVDWDEHSVRKKVEKERTNRFHPIELQAEHQPTLGMIVLVAVVDVRHRMHSFHLQNIQVHKINTTSNSQGVIDPSRYFYFYYNNDSNNLIEYSIYIIIKLLTKLFCNKPLWFQWCYYNLHLLWYANWSICKNFTN